MTEEKTEIKKIETTSDEPVKIVDKKEEKQESKQSVFDEAKESIKELQEANEEKAKLLDREEALQAKRALGGGSEAGAQPPKPVKLTDTEYAEALERGEVNPLKEDGFV